MPLQDPIQDRAVRHYVQRLFYGVSRSPALRAFPTKSVKRIDLARLRLAHGTAPEELILGVVGEGSYQLVFQRFPVGDPRREDSQTLFTTMKTKLAREAQAAHRETGLWMLWLAYPLFYAPHPNSDRRDMLLAPLLLWPIRIESLGLRENHLVIARQDDAPVFNRVASQWIRRNLQFDPGEPTNADLMGMSKFEDVITVAQRFCAGFTPVVPVNLMPRVGPVPDRPSFDRQRPALLDAGILGLLRWENMELLADLEELRDLDLLTGPAGEIIRTGEEPKSNSFKPPAESDRYFVTPTDLSQERAIWQARRPEGAVIHGPPGTGKSQVIVNIAADHLARDKTVLIVCQKKAALDVVSSRLKAAGLGDLTLQIDDAEGDRRRIIETLRSQVEPGAEAINTRDRIAADIELLENQFEAYGNALFKSRSRWGISYQTILARVARIERTQPKVRPNTRVRELLKESTVEELDALAEQLGNLEQLYQQARIPENAWATDGRPTLTGDRYELDEIRRRIDEAVRRSTKLESWRGQDSPANAELVGDVSAIGDACQTVDGAWGSVRRYIAERDIDRDEKRILAEEFIKAAFAAAAVTRLQSRVLRWMLPSYYRCRRQLRDFGSARPWLRRADGNKVLRSIAERAEAARDWESECQALHRWLEDERCAVLCREVRLAQPITQYLKRLKKYVDFIPPLIRYRSTLASLGSVGRSVVASLIEGSDGKPKNWADIVRLSAFLEWAAIAEREDPILRAKTPQLHEMDSKKLKELAAKKRSLEPALIRSRWSAKWQGIDHRWRNGLRFRGRNSLRLREVVERGRTRGIFDLRPCWLANPGTVSQVFPFVLGLFDLVVFDEASQCPPEYALPSLFRGKSVAVAGDGKQLPPTMFFRSAFDFESEEEADPAIGPSDGEGLDSREELGVATGSEDLLSLAQARLPHAHLNVHYRSLDPALIAFSNAAFYGNRLEMPRPPSLEQQGEGPAIALHRVK